MNVPCTRTNAFCEYIIRSHKLISHRGYPIKQIIDIRLNLVFLKNCQALEGILDFIEEMASS